MIKQIALGLTLLVAGVANAESTSVLQYETVCDISIAGLNKQVNEVIGRSTSRVFKCWRPLGQVVVSPNKNEPGARHIFCQTMVKVCSK